MSIFLAISLLVLLEDVEQAVSIAPGDVAEPCISLQFGNRLEFGFSAANPVDFNIHYKHDGSVKFPVDFRGLTEKQGVFIAPASGKFCLMWTNRQEEAVKLQYQYRSYTEEAKP